MIVFLLLVIAVVLIFIAKSLHEQADTIDSNFKNIASPAPEISKPKPQEKTLSYWDNWKSRNPQKYNALKILTGKNLDDISDFDAKQLVGSFQRVADTNGLTEWLDIKTVFMDKFAMMYKSIGEDESLKLIANLSKDEAEHAHIKQENCASFYAGIWFMEYLMEEKKKPQVHKVYYPEIPAKKEVSSNYWEHWKTANSDKAEVIEKLTVLDISKLPDSDVKEIIQAFTVETAQNYIVDWNDIFASLYETWSNLLVEKTFNYTAREYISLYNAYIEGESFERKIKKKNTFAYIRFLWIAKHKKFNKFMTDSDINNIQNSIILSDKLSNEDKNTVLESIKAQYIQPLNDLISRHGNNHFFCDGYDSPVARDIMNHMYSFVRNAEFRSKAERDGIWNDFLKFVWAETSRITDKYCDANIQECIEFYNFPDKPVKTSHKCPACGSKNVHPGDPAMECLDCGCEWFARLGYDMYLDI